MNTYKFIESDGRIVVAVEAADLKAATLEAMRIAEDGPKNAQGRPSLLEDVVDVLENGISIRTETR